MNCNKVSNLLSAYMDGELLGYEHRLINQHIQRCMDCRSEYEELLQMKRLLGAMRVHDPGQRLAASILQRCTSEASTSTAIRVRDWRNPLRSLRPAAPLITPMIGLGVGLACCGLLFMARPSNSAATGEPTRGAMVFEPADLSRDEPPAPNVAELTSGLMRESSPRPAAYEPRYPMDLPEFPARPRTQRRSAPPLFTAGFSR